MELIVKFVRKSGVLAAATALAASVAFVGMTTTASAAPVVAELSASEILPGGEAIMTVSGCSVGAELVIFDGTTEEGRSVVVEEGTLPMDVAIAHDSFIAADADLYRGGDAQVGVNCLPAEGSEEAPSQQILDVYLYGRWIEADPASFYAGDPVTITAGDFPAGTQVELELYPAGGDQLIFSAPLGTAGEDLSASGTVTFPEDLKCGTYALDVVGGELFVPAELYICGEPDPTPTPTPTDSPTPTPTDSPSPTPTDAPTATPTPSPTATASPTASTAPTNTTPSRPGLPSTGN